MGDGSRLRGLGRALASCINNLFFSFFSLQDACKYRMCFAAQNNECFHLTGDETDGPTSREETLPTRGAAPDPDPEFITHPPVPATGAGHREGTSGFPRKRIAPGCTHLSASLGFRVSVCFPRRSREGLLSTQVCGPGGWAPLSGVINK